MSNEPGEAEVEEYRRLLRSVRPGPLRLRSAVAELRTDTPGRLGPRLALRESAEARLASARTVVAQVRFSLTGRVGRKVALRLTAAFELAVNAEEDLSPEFSALFAAVNLPFNAWPYWRQWVVDTSCRMGLPPIVVPLRHPGPAPASATFAWRPEGDPNA